MSEDDHRTTTAIGSSALEQAASILLGGVCSDACDQEGGEAVGASSERDRRSAIQWQQLCQWAEGAGLILPSTFPPPDEHGGVEHDVRFDESVGLWWKYTNPGFSGSTVDWDGQSKPTMRMASPLEYIERLLHQNSEFNDSIELKGLWFDLHGGGWRIITTQPDVAGSAPNAFEIKDAMLGWGFEILPWPDVGRQGSLAFRKGDLLVWDAHPCNATINSDGLLVPYDFILTLFR